MIKILLSSLLASTAVMFLFGMTETLGKSEDLLINTYSRKIWTKIKQKSFPKKTQITKLITK